MNSVCFWDNTTRASEFLHFMNTCHHVAGRGSDVAGADFSDIFVDRHDQGRLTHHVLYQRITRRKTETVRTPHAMAPHRDSFFLCFYFTLFYHLIMSSEEIKKGGKMFPSFANKMSLGSSASESKVSSYINKTIDYFMNIMVDFFAGKFK